MWRSLTIMKELLDMLEEVINMDKELHVVGKAQKWGRNVSDHQEQTAGCCPVGSDHAENGRSDGDGSCQP